MPVWRNVQRAFSQEPGSRVSGVRLAPVDRAADAVRQRRRKRGTQPADYDRLDQGLVVGAAAQLNSLAGEYPTIMGGNARFAKLDFNLVVEAIAFLPAEHVTLFGNRQRIFRSGEPYHDLYRRQQWHRGYENRKRGLVMDERVEQSLVD